MKACLLRQAADGLGSVAHATPALQRINSSLENLLRRGEGTSPYLSAQRCIHADGAAPAAWNGSK